MCVCVWVYTGRSISESQVYPGQLLIKQSTCFRAGSLVCNIAVFRASYFWPFHAVFPPFLLVFSLRGLFLWAGDEQECHFQCSLGFSPCSPVDVTGSPAERLPGGGLWSSASHQLWPPLAQLAIELEALSTPKSAPITARAYGQWDPARQSSINERWLHTKRLADRAADRWRSSRWRHGTEVIYSSDAEENDFKGNAAGGDKGRWGGRTARLSQESAVKENGHVEMKYFKDLL